MFTWTFKMAAIFVKLYMSLLIHRCIDLSNPLRIYRDSIFLNILLIPGGNAPPPLKNPTGDFSATVPNRSGMYQGTSLTNWLNFYTPCKPSYFTFMTLSFTSLSAQCPVDMLITFVVSTVKWLIFMTTISESLVTRVAPHS